MGKYGLFGIIMLWLLFATYLVNAFDVYMGDATFSVDNPIGEVVTEADTDIGTIESMGLTFINAVSFKVNGLPMIVSLLAFTVPTMMLSYMAIEILIKILDAIIPF